MNLFSGRNTCFQCGECFADSNTYCPHCGAGRRENAGQLALRRLRRASMSLILGALLGVGCVVLLAMLLPGWSEKMQGFPLLSGHFGMELIGVVLGAMVGGFLYALREYSRES